MEGLTALQVGANSDPFDAERPARDALARMNVAQPRAGLERPR
jgi:hypothetical protein